MASRAVRLDEPVHALLQGVGGTVNWRTKDRRWRKRWSGSEPAGAIGMLLEITPPCFRYGRAIADVLGVHLLDKVEVRRTWGLRGFFHRAPANSSAVGSANVEPG